MWVDGCRQALRDEDQDERWTDEGRLKLRLWGSKRAPWFLFLVADRGWGTPLDGAGRTVDQLQMQMRWQQPGGKWTMGALGAGYPTCDHGCSGRMVCLWQGPGRCAVLPAGWCWRVPPSTSSGRSGQGRLVDGPGWLEIRSTLLA